jgi:menaquinone-dependent protoporphyrinogen oxidase
MSILITYATKYGATRGIAERIAQRMTTAGQHAEARPIKEVNEPGSYDAYAIGSAAYMGSWLNEAAEFVPRNQATLITKPTWLFRSGPLGTEKKDARGQDILASAEPKEFAEFKELIQPRGTQVFFGALDINKLGFFDRLVTKTPVARSANLFPEGDFRDWDAIEAWAEAIAHELESVPAGNLGRRCHG